LVKDYAGIYIILVKIFRIGKIAAGLCIPVALSGILFRRVWLVTCRDGSPAWRIDISHCEDAETRVK